MEPKPKPKVFIAMPCYDTMKVETCVSILTVLMLSLLKQESNVALNL